MRDGSVELEVAGGWDKSASGDDAVRLGGGAAVSRPPQPVLGRVLEDGRVEQVCVIRPLPDSG